jgi:hypothetical protein
MNFCIVWAVLAACLFINLGIPALYFKAIGVLSMKRMWPVLLMACIYHFLMTIALLAWFIVVLLLALYERKGLMATMRSL